PVVECSVAWFKVPTHVQFLEVFMNLGRARLRRAPISIHWRSGLDGVSPHRSWSQCPASFLFPLKQRAIRWRRAFPAGGWSAWLSQQNTFMAKSMMRAVGVL